jgi:hypothetical protein
LRHAQTRAAALPRAPATPAVPRQAIIGRLFEVNHDPAGMDNGNLGAHGCHVAAAPDSRRPRGRSGAMADLTGNA